MATIYLNKAVSLHLHSLQQAVVTRYELGTLVYRLYQTKRFRNQRIRVYKDAPQPHDVSSVINQLLAQDILSQERDFPNGRVFRIFGKQAVPAEDIACTVDPFAFVSHLSAMDFHGLTDRFLTSLYLSSPTGTAWKHCALLRTQKDCEGFFDDYWQGGFPPLQRMAMRTIAQVPVRRHGVSKVAGAYRTVKGRPLRVATIGRTFLDMVRNPSLCGGIGHVLDVFDQHAESYLPLIADEVERWGSPIDKVRVGYLLDERCQLTHPNIRQWLKFVQRGGSRKLDAQAEYSSRYSERWSLSINALGA